MKGPSGLDGFGQHDSTPKGVWRGSVLLRCVCPARSATFRQYINIIASPSLPPPKKNNRTRTCSRGGGGRRGLQGLGEEPAAQQALQHGVWRGPLPRPQGQAAGRCVSRLPTIMLYLGCVRTWWTDDDRKQHALQASPSAPPRRAGWSAWTTTPWAPARRRRRPTGSSSRWRRGWPTPSS